MSLTIIGPGTIITPVAGSVLTGSSATFTWRPGTATEYGLDVGTTGVGSQDVFNSGIVTATSAAVTGLPTSGQIVYVRLYSKVSGVWETADYTYTASGPAALIAPTPGSLLPGPSVTFTWTTGSATEFDLCVGTTGVASQDIFTTGVVTTTSATVTGFPSAGKTVYVRLYSKVNGVWQSVDYTYVMAGPAALTSPTPGSTLTGSSANFTWNAASASAFDLLVGTTGVGAQDLFTTGIVTTTSATVTDLPTTGQTVYVRLASRVNGVWQNVDYTYEAAGPAALTSPTPGSTLTGSSATFTWNAASASSFDLMVGTTGVGAQDIFTTGIVTTTSANVTGLPTTSEPLYVRLGSKVNGTWQYVDYTYTIAGPGVLTTPTPGSTLTGSSATFTWRPGTATEYGLDVGTTGVGSQDVLNSGIVTATSAAVTGLPTSGQIVYVRLYSKVGGVWQTADYTYVASG
jgi:hypothetical protein